MLKVVFLDKDGTLVKNVSYNVDPEKIEFIPGVIPGLKTLYSAGFGLIIISNQSGVARWYFREKDLKPVWERIEMELQQQGIPLLDIFYCPHHPDGLNPYYAKECECRKPEPGLLYLAAKKYNLNLADSWMVGDILDDVQAGTKAGCRTVLVDIGNETQWILGPGRLPTYLADSFEDAAEYICHHVKRDPAEKDLERSN